MEPAKKGNKAIWFIIGTVIVGTGAFFMVKHYRKKMVKQMGTFDNKSELTFNAEPQDVNVETIEQPKPIAQQTVRPLSKAEQVMDNAIEEVIQHNIVYSAGMSAQRKELMVDALQKLNLDPSLHDAKVRMFNNNRDSFEGMKKALFLYAIHEVQAR